MAIKRKDTLAVCRILNLNCHLLTPMRVHDPGGPIGLLLLAARTGGGLYVGLQHVVQVESRPVIKLEGFITPTRPNRCLGRIVQSTVLRSVFGVLVA